MSVMQYHYNIVQLLQPVPSPQMMVHDVYTHPLTQPTLTVPPARTWYMGSHVAHDSLPHINVIRMKYLILIIFT